MEVPPITVVVVDLDELKPINDTYGIGRQLISETANCLKANAEKDMIVARIGGDEFVILIPNVGFPQVEYYIKCVQKKCNGLMEFSRFRPIQMSIDYAYGNSSYRVMEQLLSMADANMYQNKKMKKVVLVGKKVVSLLYNQSRNRIKNNNMESKLTPSNLTDRG